MADRCRLILHHLTPDTNLGQWWKRRTHHPPLSFQHCVPV